MSDENSTKRSSRSKSATRPRYRPKKRETLSRRQTVFVNEYLKDFNARQAAIRAGYAESATATPWRLLANPLVASAIREGVKERVQRLGIDADDVLLRALKIYDMATSAVPVTKYDAASKSRVETGEYTFDGALAAKVLEMIGKLLGAFRDKPAAEERPFVIRIYEGEK
jgi:phage terminase small subunit